MKCRKHPYEIGAGVCTSCLRERLLAVIAAQNAVTSPENYPPPPPPQLSCNHCRSPSFFHRRFFSTPQVGPSSTDVICHVTTTSTDDRKKNSKFSFSWISSIFFRSSSKLRRNSRSKSYQDRGMSPVYKTDDGDLGTKSGCSSAYSNRSPTTGWRSDRTPVRKFHRPNWGGVSGFGVCLSPLVRPSPQLSHPDLGGGGSEHRNPRRHVLVGGAATLEPSRSRKLDDFGRFR